MKVILLKNIDNLGKKFEVKEVKPGYFRNFLYKQGFAVVATPSQIALIEKRKAEEKAKEEAQNKEFANKLKELSKKQIELTVKTGKKGEVFEKITKKKIAQAIGDAGVEIGENDVELAEPITKAGKYVISLNVKGVKGDVTVKVD